ncbi:HET-domain-containing protein [Lentithecium fluviatile CBS 122367]|uniref:HET-domain-containing protein n=1 Tax=Lentithecium fluviatile CBS 122367 TaxID=1168545 RepID=A0A6G1IPB3_9PLEO|nr:HET-domain-containing protein [Lentithecium fluviatile CBS 122367]
MLEIQIFALPKTFQDAMKIARFLRVRYLWIDALYILQNDFIDWHREAILMGKIYQESVCTLAIHSAHDDSTRFLEQSLLPPVAVHLESSYSAANAAVRLRSNFKVDVDKSKLSKRHFKPFASPRSRHRAGMSDDGLKGQWFEFLERYSNAQLTYVSDKLPAIAGLVKVFQKHTHDRYLSGIW